MLALIRVSVNNFFKVPLALGQSQNQTDIDRDMPLRLFSYDGVAYRGQLLTDRELR